MRLARISLVLAMVVAILFAGVGCTADQGWQKGVSDGVAEAIALLITAPVEVLIDNWVNTLVPAPAS